MDGGLYTWFNVTNGFVNGRLHATTDETVDLNLMANFDWTLDASGNMAL